MLGDSYRSISNYTKWNGQKKDRKQQSECGGKKQFNALHFIDRIHWMVSLYWWIDIEINGTNSFNVIRVSDKYSLDILKLIPALNDASI